MKSVREFESNSDEETRAIGRELAQTLPMRGVVLLSGELGAGKTTLSKGIVEGRRAAAADEVSSPTFTLIHPYGEPVSVYHIDLYRLETEGEVQRLGLEDLFDEDALILIEWGERFVHLMPPDRIEIRITYDRDETRHIAVTAKLPRTSPA
jgi:tRNA threonylcarbamoyladenosine biosynthesis protein TsaE